MDFGDFYRPSIQIVLEQVDCPTAFFGNKKSQRTLGYIYFEKT